MSNPRTGYICKNSDGIYQDLSGIFMPLSLGSQINKSTGFTCTINGTPTDLRDIFASISSGSPIGFNTGLTVNGVTDLSTLFAAYPSISVTSTVTPSPVSSYTYNNTKYDILILRNNETASFKQNTSKNVEINYILVGGGAGGGGGYYVKYNAPGGGGGGGGGGGYIKGYFSTSGNIVYNVVGGGSGVGGQGNNYNNNQTNGAPGMSSYISDGTNSIYAFGGSNQNNGVYNGGEYGGVQMNSSTQNLGIGGSYSYPNNLGTITNAGQGGNGGGGCDNIGRTINNEYPYGKSPTNNIGSLETGYRLSYLGKSIYVGGGGAGSSNQMTYNTDTADGVPIYYSDAQGGAPSGGTGGGAVGANIIFQGGDALATGIYNNIYIDAYGGGGGGGYWDYFGPNINPSGGNGRTGCAILWWIK